MLDILTPGHGLVPTRIGREVRFAECEGVQPVCVGRERLLHPVSLGQRPYGAAHLMTFGQKVENGLHGDKTARTCDQNP